MGIISNQNTLNRTELQANINPHQTQCAYSFITNEESKPALFPIKSLKGEDFGTNIQTDQQIISTSI